MVHGSESAGGVSTPRSASKPSCTISIASFKASVMLTSLKRRRRRRRRRRHSLSPALHRTVPLTLRIPTSKVQALSEGSRGGVRTPVVAAWVWRLQGKQKYMPQVCQSQGMPRRIPSTA